MIKKLQEKQVPFQFVPAQKLNRLTGGNHQGLIAFVSEIEYVDLEMVIPGVFEDGRLPALVILDGITDVRNIGAITRSAVCAGMDALVLPTKGSAQINADAIKASAGSLQLFPVCRYPKLTDAAGYIKSCGIQLVAASEKATDLIYAVDLKKPTAFILGAEDSGISPALLRQADHLVRIPVYGQVRSLNVSVAAAILFYEMIRQREFNAQ